MTKVFTAPDGFAILLLNEEYADQVFSRQVKEELQQNGFTPLLPPELKVKKSVILTRLDDLIYDREEGEIIDEIVQHNSWVEDNIDTIYKFPNSATIKVTFTQTSLAKRCTEKGLLAFNLRIPPDEIKQETYVQVRCCMRCYKLEAHNTRDCDKPNDYKICSECSTEGHLWHQCRETIKTCVNCGDEHSTLAMKCSRRKEVIKEKKKEETERGRMTYTGVTRSLIQQQSETNHYSPPSISREDILRINICVSHSHYRNIEYPGTYEEELNKILKLNNLPSIKIPDIPNSAEIYNITTGKSSTTKETESESTTQRQRQESSSQACEAMAEEEVKEKENVEVSTK